MGIWRVAYLIVIGLVLSSFAPPRGLLPIAFVSLVVGCHGESMARLLDGTKKNQINVVVKMRRKRCSSRQGAVEGECETRMMIVGRAK